MLFTSCGIINKGTFTARRYTKGVFFEKRAKSFHSNQVWIQNTKVIQQTKSVSNELKVLNKPDSIFKKTNYNNTISFKKTIKPQINYIHERQVVTTLGEKEFYEQKVFKKCKLKKTGKDGAKSNNGNGKEAFNFVLYTFLFIIMTVVYTFSILIRMPGFPVILAVPLAMVLAFLTVITGVIFF